MSARGWSHEASPFHLGEQIVQSRIGVRDQVERAGRNMIRDLMPDQHRALFEALPLLVVGSIDADGRPWASLLAGPPGFVRSPTEKSLQVHAEPARGDPLSDSLSVGRPLGVLGIQLETRRRNRANGHIVAREAGSFTIEIEQSFGNCKQYIQAREPHYLPELQAQAGEAVLESGQLSERARQLLERCDTLFLATASARAASGADAEGVDVSHRGGRPGFVRVEPRANGTRLTMPDFRGNFMFNTFGNLEVNPRAGIVCADFATGDVLTLTGTARVIWEGPEVDAFEGAERLLQFDVELGHWLPGTLPLRFVGFEPSPYILETGTWAEAAERD